jgi:hypothetical protein
MWAPMWVTIGGALLWGPWPITVVDGDTVDRGWQRHRLVGFDAPEIRRAACEAERQRGLHAKARLAELLRSAQRRLRRIECAASSRVAGYGVHSSKIITTSEFSTRWIRIDSSGVRNSLSPFTGLWNLTPCSVILRNAPRLNT